MQVNSAVAPLVRPTSTVAVPPTQLLGAQVAGANQAQAQGDKDDALSAQEKQLDEKLKEIQRCLKRLEALQSRPRGCAHAPGTCDCFGS